MGIADFFYLLQSPLLFKSVGERLNGGVSNTLVLWEAFQDLAHRRDPQFPELLQNASFGFGKTRLFHNLLRTTAMLLQPTAYWLSAPDCAASTVPRCEHRGVRDRAASPDRSNPNR